MGLLEPLRMTVVFSGTVLNQNIKSPLFIFGYKRPIMATVGYVNQNNKIFKIANVSLSRSCTQKSPPKHGGSGITNYFVS